MHLAATKLSFLGHPATLIVVTLLALGELVADKLPRTPARTSPPGLIARIVLGGLCGVALATSAGASLVAAAAAGVAGALVGTFGGYNIRRAQFRLHTLHAPEDKCGAVFPVGCALAHKGPPVSREGTGNTVPPQKRTRPGDRPGLARPREHEAEGVIPSEYRCCSVVLCPGRPASA